MPIKPREMEKLILADGWVLKNQEGSHKNYIHPVKPGKVTIPFHSKDLPKGTENRRGLNNPIFFKHRRCKLCYQCIQPVSSKRRMVIRSYFLI